MSLNVVVEGIPIIRFRQRHQVHARRDAEVRRREDAVGVAERAAEAHVWLQAQVGRTEAWGPTGYPVAEDEGTVLRPLQSCSAVIRMTEKPAFPFPAIPAWMRSQPAVARAGLEL